MIDSEWKVTTPLMNHQIQAVDKMKPSRVGALFMDMGTGKSLVVISLAIARAEKISKIVWCCPVSLKRNTVDQIKTHTDISDEMIYLFDDKTTDANMPPAVFYVVGLESIGSSDRVVMALNALVDENTMIIADESGYIKGHKSKRTRRLTLIGSRARYRMILNGTPISQGIEDLYAQMNFLSDRILGYRSWYSFSRAHLEYSDKYKGMIVSRDRLDWLSQKIAPYTFQVTKEECLDLPPKTFSNHYVPLTSEQYEMYEHAKEVFIEEANLMADDLFIEIFRLFHRLRSIANGVIPSGFCNAGGTIKTGKEEELTRLVRSYPDKQPVVIWVKYQRSVDVVATILEQKTGRHVSRYFGKYSEQKRDEELRLWRENGGYFVATTACGGFGLTLTESCYSVFFTNDFKYSERLQSEDRLYRIGQNRSVHYASIWADAGIEEKIEDAIASKADGLQRFRDEIEKVKLHGKDKVIEYLRGL